MTDEKDGYPKRRRELMVASFALGQAQRDLEEAEARFKEALRNIERFEDEPWAPTATPDAPGAATPAQRLPE
jgi:hypothetical protein